MHSLQRLFPKIREIYQGCVEIKEDNSPVTIRLDQMIREYLSQHYPDYVF